MAGIRRWDLRLGVTIAIAVVLLVVFVSCRPAVDSGPKDPPANITFSDATSVEPDKLPYPKASLILAGASYPVDVKRKVEGESIEFTFESHGETIDKEGYRLTKQAFQLVQGAGMTFEPPLDLVLFPMSVGQSWAWSGRISADSEAQKAHANISSEKASLNLESGFFDGFKINVDLEIADAGPAVSKKLAFWIVPKRGIIKREFGSTSTRGPASE